MDCVWDAAAGEWKGAAGAAVAGPAFTATGSGTNLIRTASINGRVVRISSGHGYDRPHQVPGGGLTDLRQSGLTRDEVELAILRHLSAYLSSGGALPVVGPGTVPLAQVFSLAAVTIRYVVVELPGGTIHVSTYSQQ